MPGFTFAGVSVDGLIRDVQWGDWDVKVQYATMFGQHGTSSIEGKLSMRPFAFPMMIWGFSTVAARDALLDNMDLSIGTVGTLVASTAASTIINYQNIRMAGVSRGKPGWDPNHLFYREVLFRWEQLMPAGV